MLCVLRRPSHCNGHPFNMNNEASDKYTDTQRLDYFEEYSSDFLHLRDVTMCGTYPCWSYWSPDEGRNKTTQRKTLRQAIDAALDNGGAKHFFNKAQH